MSNTSTQQRIQCFKDWLDDFKKKPKFGKSKVTESELLKIKYGYATKSKN